MYNPQETETKILGFWDENKIFEKLREKNKGNEVFSFLDGPITANNPMGVHHAWGRTYKDTFQRYKAMQGKDQRYQNGFDCQGLWVEVEVEKDLGLKTKKDIIDMGLEKFSKACRERVAKYSKVQADQSIRLGMWMDWNNSYYTHDDSNIEAIWHFLKKCHEKKWLYKTYRVMLYCPRCETTLSQHEMADAYKEITETSIYVKFELKDEPGTYFLAWTTTPWTLPGHSQLYVKPGEEYVKVEVERDGKKERYIVAEACLKILKENYKILEKFKAEKLIGKEYEPPFEYLKGMDPKYYHVDLADYAEIEQGTGVVHSAVMYGDVDYARATQQGLKEIHTVDKSGRLNELVKDFQGMFFKDADPQIIKFLEEKGKIYKTEKTMHKYPFCWRCGTPVLYYADTAWFIKSDPVRSKMKSEAKKAYWYPEHAGKLMQDWLDNMGDWNISRKRFWGLPLMFFECKKCDKVTVIGSKKELRENAVDPAKVDALPELHRPWIDDVKIKCPKCKAEVERVQEVGDCWLDAGIVPYSTMGYFTDKDYWEKWFPADFICEMREQVRLWFYAILFMSVTLDGRTPYKSVLGYEKVHDEKGKPMHKSAGNAIWFDDAVEKMGADVMRWIYVTQTPTANLNFGYGPAKENNKKLSYLVNVTEYLEQNKRLNKDIDPLKEGRLRREDRWIVSKLNSLTKTVTQEMNELHPHKATLAIEEFLIDNLSRTYIQLIRERLTGTDRNERQAVIYTLNKVVLELLKLMAPFVPFLTEDLYQKSFKAQAEKESIHLNDWPVAHDELIDKDLETEITIAMNVAQTALNAREKAKLGIRWPLKEMIVVTKDRVIESTVEGLKRMLMSQLNVKEIKTVKEEIESDEYASAEMENAKVFLHIKLSEELETEGYAREIIRRVQDARKKAKLKKEDAVDLNLRMNRELIERLNKWGGEIKEKTGTKNLVVEMNALPPLANSEKFNIRGKQFELALTIPKTA